MRTAAPCPEREARLSPQACKVTLREMLPESVQPIGDLLGDAALMRLIEAHGGTRLSVPAKVRPLDPLAVMLGAKPARRLAVDYGPGTITVPLCKRWRAALLRKQGLPYAAIARRLGMHEQSVYRLLSPGAARRPADVTIRQLRLELE